MARRYRNIGRIRQRIWLGACLMGLWASLGCSAKKPANDPITEERAGSRAIDYVPRGAELAVHLNVAKLRKSPLFLAAVGYAKGYGGEAWLAHQEKECGFPLLYAFEDLVFVRTEEGELLISRLGVGADEMTKCWDKLHDRNAKIAWPESLPDYDMLVRDGLVFFGDPRTVLRAKKMAKPTVHDPRRLELAGDEALRAEGSLELGPFRNVSMILETDKDGFAAQADLEAYSERVAAIVHRKLAEIREHTLERAKNPLSREVMKSVRVSSLDSTLTLRANYRGSSEEQLRYVDLLVELALEIGGRAVLEGAKESAAAKE